MKKERREVRNLILMLSSAVCVAFVAVVGLVYYLGSSGTYLLSQVLVSPETLEKGSFVGYDSAPNDSSRYIFNKIEFVQADTQEKERALFEVGWHAYTDFYKIVASEKSIPVVKDNIIEQFQHKVPSTLTIFVTEGNRKEKVFQRVEFMEEGDLFRVQRHSAADADKTFEKWIYFQSPGIYKQVIGLFTSPFGSRIE